MSFAMGGSTNWLCWIVGGATALNGLFNAAVMCTHPAFREGKVNASDDPWAGQKTAEAEVGAYLAARPDLVLKAVQVVREVNGNAPPPQQPQQMNAGSPPHARSRGASNYNSDPNAIANPYAIVVANSNNSALSQPSGPGRPTDYYSAYGGSSAAAMQQQQQQPSYTTHTSSEVNKWGGQFVGIPPSLPGGGPPRGPATIRVQTTVTQHITSTVIDYSGHGNGAYYGGAPTLPNSSAPIGAFGVGPGFANPYAAYADVAATNGSSSSSYSSSSGPGRPHPQQDYSSPPPFEPPPAPPHEAYADNPFK